MTEALDLDRRYTSKDFTALRAFVQRIPAATIARTYYDVDEDPHAATPTQMERYLRTMLDALVQLAIAHGSSVLAEHLQASIKRHGSARLTAVSLKMVAEAAQLAAASPSAEHGLGMWLRPKVAKYLRGEGIQTLGALVAFCNRRGPTWWRSVPRIGPGRAQILVQWLRRHADTLGVRVDADVDRAEPFQAPAAQRVALSAGQTRLAPLERMDLPHALSGAQGANRASTFCYVAAAHDLAAIRAYLNRYRDQPKTLRAYTKELERFVLWAIGVRGTAVSSLLVEDCEAYKDFLAAPSPSFVGPRAPRHSRRWYPFATATLSADSQRYAVRALRAAFSWLVDVRYLAGNPWKAVKDPSTVTREAQMQIHRALPATLWQTLRAALEVRCQASEGDGVNPAQWRAARAAMLLMGDSGLRREEAAQADRAQLRLSPHSTVERPVWALQVVGKRNKERTVPVSRATLEALRAHWQDRGRDFDLPIESAPLLAPLIIPNTPQAQRKHDGVHQAPYTADSLNRLVRWALRTVSPELEGVSAEDLVRLAGTSAHAFRHTFGTQATAKKMPLDVVQKVLGHASLQTTSIYVQAEQQRIMEEAARYYADDAADDAL